MTKYLAYMMIVPRGKGSKVIHTAFEYGINNSTLLQAKGTVRDGFLNMLGFYDNEKEFIVMLAEEGIGSLAIEKIVEKYKINRPNNGIIFSVPLGDAFGVEGVNIQSQKEEKMGQQIIFTIVDRGLSGKVVDCASKAGAPGGTILLGRGSGIENVPKLFNIEIEPEKEIVLMIIDASIKDKIVQAISEEMNISEPNKGIIFVLDLHETHGLHNKQ